MPLVFIPNDLLDRANPYVPWPIPGGITSNFELVNGGTIVEQQLDAGPWTFKGVPHHIEKALRIPYIYLDDDGVQIREYLLIGFAGGGAY